MKLRMLLFCGQFFLYTDARLHAHKIRHKRAGLWGGFNSWYRRIHGSSGVNQTYSYRISYSLLHLPSVTLRSRTSGIPRPRNGSVRSTRGNTKQPPSSSYSIMHGAATVLPNYKRGCGGGGKWVPSREPGCMRVHVHMCVFVCVCVGRVGVFKIIFLHLLIDLFVYLLCSLDTYMIQSECIQSTQSSGVRTRIRYYIAI
jgi:hypothetical protein